MKEYILDSFGII